MKQCKICAKYNIKFWFTYVKYRDISSNRWWWARVPVLKRKDMHYLDVCKYCHRSKMLNNLLLGKEFKVGKNYYDYDQYSIKRSEKIIRAHKNKYYVIGPVIPNFFGEGKHLFSRQTDGFMTKNKVQAVKALNESNAKLDKYQKYILYDHAGEVFSDIKVLKE